MRRQPAGRTATWRSMAAASVLLGAATGLRSQIAVATLVVRGDAGLPAALRHPWAPRVAVAAAGGELIADKLPSTPSRLAPSGLVPRVVLGALAAGLHARTRGAASLPAAAIGASAAAVAARLGHDLRAVLSKRAPTLAATVEDEAALGLAIAGATR
jgi:uncharacterized membrane protein